MLKATVLEFIAELARALLIDELSKRVRGRAERRRLRGPSFHVTFRRGRLPRVSRAFSTQGRRKVE